MPLRLSMYHVVTQTFRDELDGALNRVLFSTRTANTVIISESAWDNLCKENLDALPRAVIAQLIDLELLIPSDQDELSTVLARQRDAALDSDSLNLVIQPTAACQLACGYCGQEHSHTQLSEKHQDLFLQSVRRKLELGRYRSLGIGWFGAEPLAGLHVMRRMSPRLKSLATEFGCTYAASVTTNGLSLTDEIATELAGTHFVTGVTVSIDGLRETHDIRRPTKTGGRSFDRILDNLLRLCRRPDIKLNIDVRANVDGQNADQVAPLLQLLAAAGVEKRVRFYIAPIHSWGNDAHERSLSPQEFADREIGWFAEMARLGFHLSLAPDLVPIVCIAVKPDSEVVDARGELYNCTEVSYVPAYGTPNRFGVGHVERGSDTEARRVLGDFHTRVASGAYDCSSCRMLPVCGGACPKQWLEGRASCPSAKHNVEDRLLLGYALSRIGERLTNAVAA
jgi:uncharacterized protein